MLKVEEKKEIILIKTKRKFKKADNFQKFYVTGAIGGFKNAYDFRLTFYNIDSNEFILKSQSLKDNKNMTNSDFKDKLSEIEVPHILKCELIMTEKAVKELYNFLKIELESLRKSKLSLS